MFLIYSSLIATYRGGVGRSGLRRWKIPAFVTATRPGSCRPNGVNSNGGRPPKSHITHFTFHPFHSLTRFTSLKNRCCAIFLPSRSHLFSPSHGIHSQSFHPLPLPPTLERASFSTSSISFLGRGFRCTQTPSKARAQYVATECILVGWPSCALSATSGATAATPEFVPRQITGGWHRGAAQHAPPRSHQPPPPPPRGGVLRHGVDMFYSLFRGLPLPEFFFHRSPVQTSTSTPGPALEGGWFLQLNCNGIQHFHAELQDFFHHHQVLVACVQETKLCMNSSLKEFTGYGYHQARSPSRRRWWTCHTRPLFRPLQVA